MSSFTISPTFNKNKVFLLQKSEVEKRLDPDYYHLERRFEIDRLKKSKHLLKSLKSTASFPKIILSENPDNLPYIGLEDIESNTGTYFNNSEKENFGTALYFKTGNVLFPKLRPYLNKVHLADFDGICSTEFVILDSKKVSAKFLSAFLRSSIVVNQTKHMMSGNTLPRLQTEDIENILVPIPDETTQNKVVSIMEIAFKQKKQNEAQAEKLLASIDDYLLKELGITLPTLPENILKNRIYKIFRSEISGSRLDPYYFSKYFFEVYKSIKAGKYPANSISSITVNIDTGRTPSRDSYVEDERENKIPIVKAGSYTGDFIDFSKCDYTAMDFKGNEIFKGDIFILGAAHQAEYVGKKVYYMNEIPKTKTFFVGELVRISANPLKYDSSLLFSILKTKIYSLLLNREKRGQTSHLYPDDVKHIIIPVPLLAKQKEIAEHITDIRKQAQQLKDKTKEALKKASEEIEKILLD